MKNNNKWVNKKTLLVLNIILATLSVACGKDADEEKENKPSFNLAPLSVSGVEIGFEESMLSATQNLVNDDFTNISKINLSTKDNLFLDMFGGPSSKSVLNFIDERVNIVVPFGFEPELSALVSEETEANYKLAAVTGKDEKKATVAENLGVAYWLGSVVENIPSLRMKIGNTFLKVNSPRIGLVKLGEHYSEFEQFVRMSTWVHEARHSDCTGGLSDSQIKKIRETKEIKDTQNWTCGHLHSICPKGHDYEGLAACDNSDWGAYAVGAVFGDAVAADCLNCTLEQKKIAQIYALDSWSRVLNAEQLKSGQLGKPNMTSAF